mgnify:CR=1 FL=1
MWLKCSNDVVMKKLFAVIVLISSSFMLKAQSELMLEGVDIEKYTNEFLDSLDVRKKLVINDYSMLGISYGANLSQVMWNPRQKQDFLILPMNVGISYTKYGKMFNYMPYFGFQIGLNYTREGYQFEYNEDKDYTYKIEGAEKAVYEVLELPMYMHCHYDMWNFKIMAQLGCFGGYRLGIERFPGVTGGESKYPNSFAPYEKRIDYGLKGGLGFGLVFDPIEIHIQATYKHSLSSIYEPDYNSEYYYRFAYPAGITVSAGIYFQLTKRSGKTKAELKKEAKKLVYEQEKTDELDNSKGW